MNQENLEVREGVPRIVERVGISSFFDSPHWATELRELGWLPEKVIICDPLSYCAGVERANQAADQLLSENKGEVVYFYHAPIHNDTKVAEWQARGAEIVNSLEEVLDSTDILFSGHGIGPSIWLQARALRLKGIDATCPLVEKTHRDVQKFAEAGYKILLIGRQDHDEIVGTVDFAPNDIVVVHPDSNFEEVDLIMRNLENFEKIAISTQTTLAYTDLLDLIDFVVSKRADIVLPKVDDVCYATQNRQEAVAEVIKRGDVQLVIVFGSDESKGVYRSNNSISLRDVAIKHGTKSYLVEDVSEIKAEWFKGVNRIGVSAGASAAPERVVEFLACFRQIGLRNNQILRITVAAEPQVFAPARRFDFSKGS